MTEAQQTDMVGTKARDGGHHEPATIRATAPAKPPRAIPFAT